MSAPFAQSAYQVRFDWDAAGARRLGPADLVVVVDVFGLSAEGAVPDADDESFVADVAGGGSVVALGGLRNAAAVARWVMAEQTARGHRTSVAVIARTAPVLDGGRFAVENHLAAGAVVAALGDLGIDHCSPDAAVAAEGFRALRGAVRHLFTASGSGLVLAAAGRRDQVLAAAELDAASLVPVFRDGAFTLTTPAA